MNIFVLDTDPKIAAHMHCDKHVVKMILETAQLLSTAIRETGGNYGYKSTHRNHPCTVWAGKSKENFNWLKRLGIELCKEYTRRYGKVHKSQSIIENASDNTIPDGELTAFAQAMPDFYRHENAVTAYRNYYLGAKSQMLKYTNREPPDWMKAWVEHE